METIGKQEIRTFPEDGQALTTASCSEVRHSLGYTVQSYMDLATKVAELQFANRDFVLLFRGQTKDYRNQVPNTVLQSSIFRSSLKADNYSKLLKKRFDDLERAEELLIDHYQRRWSARNLDHLQKYQIIRWSLLQHYEVCPTPLLDVTHSLRVAASFASDGADSEAFIFVLGVPNLSGAITASSESGVQIIRLASVCPPEAIRPHIQEGYLLGEYPVIDDLEQKGLYDRWEIDFGRRLVAKFKFNPKTFWNSDDFAMISHDALYPPVAQDPLRQMAEELKLALAIT